MSGLNTYLRVCRQRLAGTLIQPSSSAPPLINFVMGNESADLDSVVCSVTYAYFCDWKQQRRKDQRKEKEQEKKEKERDLHYIPLINIPREDFVLRTEVVHAFQVCEIDWKELIFIDDQFPHSSSTTTTRSSTTGEFIERLREGNGLQLTLVDHNLPCHRQLHLTELIREVVDHHKDEITSTLCVSTTGEAVQEKEGNGLLPFPVYICPVGSCSTLVGEKIREEKMLLMEEDGEEHKSATRMVAELILAAILVDTNNMCVQTGKGTAQDAGIIEYLTTNHLTRYDTAALVQTFLEDLKRAKGDIGALSTTQLLRRDYKETVVAGIKFGISSVNGISSEGLRVRDGEKDVVDAMENYRCAKHLDLLLVMYSYSSSSGTGQFCRDLDIVGRDEKEVAGLEIGEGKIKLPGLMQGVCEYLAESKDPDFRLEKLAMNSQELEGRNNAHPPSNYPVCVSYLQHNVKLSRKQLMPKVVEFCHSQEGRK